LARGLTELGARVTVLTPHAENVRQSWDDYGADVRSFRYAPEQLEVLGYSRSLQADEGVKKLAAVVAPAYLAAASRAVGRTLAEGYDVLHTHWIVPNGLISKRSIGRTPMFMGLHGSDVFMAERRELRPFVRRALSRASGVTGCSPELVARVCALGFDPARSHVIPYGVDTNQFSPLRERRTIWRDRLGIPTSAVIVLSVGRMVTKKGYDYLIEAIPKVLRSRDDVHIVLGGTGDRLHEYKLVTRPWADRVHFPGLIARDVLPDLYRAADVFVLPAIHDRKGNVDGLPNVVLEAMASGLPVVASSVSGIPLAVHDGVHGRLVREKDSAALGSALIELIETPDLSRRMGAAARARAQSELTWNSVARRYANVYTAGAR
jgi:glycosyltransferase involved in cell wall biosynthesis